MVLKKSSQEIKKQGQEREPGLGVKLEQLAKPTVREQIRGRAQARARAGA